MKTIRGVIAPILTPFNDDMSIAIDLYVEHARSLLQQGCAGITPFGTTGEALSVGIDERIAAIQALVDGGIEPGCLIPGTGLSNVADTARLSGACLEIGCNGVMTLPPFYFKDVSEHGLYDYFVALLEAIGEKARIYLYHIPPVAVVGIPVSLASRLHKEFPERIVGIKDSSGDKGNTMDLLGIDGLIVYPGSEMYLLEALDHGAAGCITATANMNADHVARVIRCYDEGDSGQAHALHETVKDVRLAIQAKGPIPAQKRLLAIATGDSRWANVRPPLQAMSEDDGLALAESLWQDYGFELEFP